MSQPDLLTKPNSPPRPKHQTTRSITEASFPKIHRPHHVHIHRHHKDGKAKETQSAHPNLQNNGWGAIEGFRSEAVTPNGSRSQSRRTSILGIPGEIEGPPSFQDERRVVREGEVEAEKEKAVLRATELRNALQDLNSLSTNTASRLDNAYWRVLEKVSDLRRTIATMKELATMTRSLNQAFKTESQEIVTEVETALQGFQGFNEQQKRIEDLATRVKTGREKIRVLGERAQVVKGRVDGWERAEGEWQERTRRRLKVLWIVIAICGGLFFVGMVLQYTPARTQGPGVLKGISMSTLGGPLGPGTEGKVPDFVRLGAEDKNESWSLNRSKAKLSEKLKERTERQKQMDEDPRLRMFDEL